MRLAALQLVTGLVFVPALAAQTVHMPSRAGRRASLPREREIALARSAAPASVSGSARVLLFTDTGFVIGEAGAGGVTCFVNRSWPDSIEPHCFDAEASESILPMELERTMLYHRGQSEAEVERAIGEGLLNGRFRLPRRPAMSYMMSDAQRLIGDDGSPAGHWRPHIMIYYPYLTNSAVGLPRTPDMTVGMVSDEGHADASLVIVMPAFVKPVASAP